jgi:SAM-dependent methyltransferase
MPDIDRRFGRQAFGDDPANYDAARPDYPTWVFERLRERCGLGPGCAVFEVGAGTGKATRPLLAAGADPLIAIEPDARSAGFLRASTASQALDVRVETFEEAALPSERFDLGVCATAFHWLDERLALAKVVDVLKPGGWWAMVWNVFGDPERADPFHEATDALLNAGPRSQGQGGANANAPSSAFGRVARFETVQNEQHGWDLVLDPDQVVALYATFSPMTARPLVEQRRVLAELRRIAAAPPFSGRVVRNMITTLWTARRRSRLGFQRGSG